MIEEKNNVRNWASILEDDTRAQAEMTARSQPWLVPSLLCRMPIWVKGPRLEQYLSRRGPSFRRQLALTLDVG